MGTGTKKRNIFTREVFFKIGMLFFTEKFVFQSVLWIWIQIFIRIQQLCESRSVLVFRIWIHTINNESWYFLRSVNYPQQQHVTCECVGTVSRIDCQT